MAARAFEPSFLAVLPVSRAREEIVAAVGAAASGNASDAARAAIAEIELLIADGDSYNRRGEITPALNAFEKARAAIYRLLYPGFDLSHYLGSVRAVLPVSAQIEKALLTVAGSVVEAIRPRSEELTGAFWAPSTDPVPPNLAAFIRLGLRDANPGDQLVQVASERGAALLASGRPEAALALLDSAAAAATGAFRQRELNCRQIAAVSTAFGSSGTSAELLDDHSLRMFSKIIVPGWPKASLCR